jgi:hypothetical protein
MTFERFLADVCLMVDLRVEFKLNAQEAASRLISKANCLHRSAPPDGPV